MGPGITRDLGLSWSSRYGKAPLASPVTVEPAEGGAMKILVFVARMCKSPRAGKERWSYVAGLSARTMLYAFLSWTYGRILDFSFGGRTETAHEIALESASRFNFRGFAQHLSSRSRS